MGLVDITWVWDTLHGSDGHYMGLVDITWVWETFHESGGHYMGLGDITWVWETLHGSGRHYMGLGDITSGCPLQGKIRENREFCEKMGKIREFYKNMSGKYQGIFSLFHNLKKITEMMLYMIKMATFFDENHLNYLYIFQDIYYISPGKWGNYQGKIRESVSPN